MIRILERVRVIRPIQVLKEGITVSGAPVIPVSYANIFPITS